MSWRIVFFNTKKHNAGVFHIKGIFCKVPECGRRHIKCHTKNTGVETAMSYSAEERHQCQTGMK